MGNNFIDYKNKFNQNLEFLHIKQNTQQYLQENVYDTKILTLSKNQLQAQLKIFQLRFKMQKYVVKVYQVQLINQNIICDDNVYLKVKIQKFIKLSQVKLTNENEGLYLLLNILYGFGQLYQYFKCNFKISENMIGINLKGEVKVWINQNFVSNNFQKSQCYGSEKQSEANLVNCIFKLIQEKILDKHFTNILKSIKKQYIQKYTFIQAIISIKKYARVNNFRIPLKIQRLNDQSFSLNTSVVFTQKSIKPINKSKKSKEAIPISVSPIKTQIFEPLSEKEYQNRMNTLNMKKSYESKNLLKFQGSISKKITAISFISNKQNIENPNPTPQIMKQNRKTKVEGSVLIYEPSDNINESLLNGTMNEQN